MPPHIICTVLILNGIKVVGGNYLSRILTVLKGISLIEAMHLGVGPKVSRGIAITGLELP